MSRFPAGARVLEVGCGTGAVTRELVAWPGVAEVVGLGAADPLQACADAWVASSVHDPWLVRRLQLTRRQP